MLTAQTKKNHEASIPPHPLDRFLAVGTRSILFGAHQFVLHPICVLWGWCLLYGFPRDPRVWIAIAIHDLGYWGRVNMDGEIGEQHPAWAGAVMDRWFGRAWGDLCRGHSRYYARLKGIPTSKLMRADKLATCLIPFPLYLLLCWLSGEGREYIIFHKAAGGVFEPTLRSWARAVRADWWQQFGPGAPEA